MRLVVAIVPYQEEPDHVGGATDLLQQWVKNKLVLELRGGDSRRFIGGSNCCLLFLQLGDVLPAGVYVHGVTAFEVARYRADAAAIALSDFISYMQLVWLQESSREPRYTCPGESPLPVRMTCAYVTGVLPWRH